MYTYTYTYVPHLWFICLMYLSVSCSFEQRHTCCTWLLSAAPSFRETSPLKKQELGRGSGPADEGLPSRETDRTYIYIYIYTHVNDNNNNKIIIITIISIIPMCVYTYMYNMCMYVYIYIYIYTCI